MEWAAVPATSARPSSVRNRRARCRADGSPRRPKPAAASGWRGQRRAWSPGRRAGSCPGRGPAARRAGRRRARPAPATGRRRPRWVRRRRPGPPPRGWAKATDGVSSRTPWAARSMSAKAGEASRSGWTAEQTSWRNPGRVSSAVRQPPPGSSGGLVDVDRQAGPGQVSAATSPLGPGAHDDGVCVPHGSVTASDVVPPRPRSPAPGSRRTGTRCDRPRRRCAPGR